MPGFGGLYFDRDGNPVVYLVDTAERSAAERYVAETQEARGLEPRPVSIRLGSFDYSQLREWHDQILPVVFSRNDVVSLDIDETRNRIAIGIENEALASQVRDVVAALEVPDAAVYVKERLRPERRVTLRDKRRPTLSGFEIMNERGQDYVCTLGLNARVNGQRVFVADSHCSYRWYSNPDYHVMYQDTVRAGNEIGYEIMDRPSYRCTGGFIPCRWSDASIFRYYGGVSDEWERVARTVDWTEGEDGPLTLDPNTPTFRINKEIHILSVGQTVYKVGRTTGWTKGRITETCVTISFPDIIIRCQNVTDLWSKHGDSSSPIFTWLPKPNYPIGVHGILLGGPEGVWDETWYGPITGIETDLGVDVEICDDDPINC